MITNRNMVSNKAPGAPRTFSKFYDFAQNFTVSERNMAAMFREELIAWSMFQTRNNLVEWFSFEIERLIEHLEDSELGISEAAKELEMPRSIRREIERDARKSAKKRAETVAKLRRLQKDLPTKTKGKEFWVNLSDMAKGLLIEATRVISADETSAFFFKQFISNLEELAPVFRVMDSGDDPKALSELLAIKGDDSKTTTREVAIDVRWRLAILLSAMGKSTYSVSQAKNELAESVAVLTSEVATKDMLEKRVRQLERQLRESESRAERSVNDAAQSASRNGELRSQITELNRQVAELKSAPVPLAESVQPFPNPSAVQAGDAFADDSKSASEAASKGDESLLAYAGSLEGDLVLLRGQNESNARLLSEQASYVRMLEDRLADARRENDKVRDSLHFMAKVERDVEGASSDDLMRYLALSDAPCETKEAASAHIVAFLERFLQNTTKGASSGMNVNGGESGTACGKYSNNLLNPVFNYLKTHARTTHPQRFLDRMCQVEWGALLDEYSGGEATAMGNKKERVVTGVRHLFRNADSQKRLPLFSAVGYLADMLAEYDVGNADLWRLADNMRSAVQEDPVKRHLRELVVSLIPARQNVADE